jgi:hypothetical protein
MTLGELGAKLNEWDETRELAQAQLDALALREQRVEDLEADRDTLLRDMADMVPESLDGHSGEERHRVYGMLRIEVTPIPEGFQVSGALSDTFRSLGPMGTRRQAPYLTLTSATSSDRRMILIDQRHLDLGLLAHRAAPDQRRVRRHLFLVHLLASICVASDYHCWICIGYGR